MARNSSCDFIHLADALVGGHLWKFRSAAWTGRVALPHSVTHSSTHASATRTHSLIHPFIHSFIHTFRAHAVAATAAARSALIRFLKSCTIALYPFWLSVSLCIPQHSCHAPSSTPRHTLPSFSLLQYFTRWLSCCMQSPKLPQFACIVRNALYVAPRPLACLLLASDLADTLRWTAVQCVEKLKWIWIFTFLTRNYDNSTKARTWMVSRSVQAVGVACSRIQAAFNVAYQIALVALRSTCFCFAKSNCCLWRFGGVSGWRFKNFSWNFFGFIFLEVRLSLKPNTEISKVDNVEIWKPIVRFENIEANLFFLKFCIFSVVVSVSALEITFRNQLSVHYYKF